MNEKQLKQIQVAIQFLENKTNIPSGNEEVKNEDLIKLSSKMKSKEYEVKSKDYTGEKTDGFRKQGEFGPKKFIKP